MDDIMREQFMAAVFRMKRYGGSLPAACEFQYAELTVMQRVTGTCPLAGKGLNVNEVQECLNISKSAVSQILSSLERKGYIVRQIDKRDRRRIEVLATPAGESVLRQATESYQLVMDELLSRYGEENMRVLLEKLTLLANVYDELEEELRQLGG